VLELSPLPLQYVRSYWREGLIVLLSCFSIVSCSQWSSTHDKLVAERAAHALDIKSFKTAQTQAEQKIKDTTQRLQQESKVKADAADESYRELYAKYRANLLRYKADQGVRSGPSGGQQTGTPEEPARSGASPQLYEGEISIAMADANICVENTARLEAAHEWALRQ
jgi:hypothetical protein